MREERKRGGVREREAAGKSKTQQGNETGEIFMRERDRRTERKETKSQTQCSSACVCV